MERLTTQTDLPSKTTAAAIEKAIPELDLNEPARQRLGEICERFPVSQVEQLTGRLRNLLEGDRAHKLHLLTDWARNSFSFTLLDAQDRVIVNGGLIWHGDEQSGHQTGGSIQMTPQYGWQVHT